MRTLVNGRSLSRCAKARHRTDNGTKPDTQVAAGDRVDRRDRRGLADREGFLAWAMLLPSIIYIAVLVGFWRSLLNTIVFTVGSMLLIVVFGKALANILVADFHGKWIVRFCVLLPWTTPVALSAIAWL
jgi:multiple sugar transport system permease protein